MYEGPPPINPVDKVGMQPGNPNAWSYGFVPPSQTPEQYYGGPRDLQEEAARRAAEIAFQLQQHQAGQALAAGAQAPTPVTEQASVLKKEYNFEDFLSLGQYHSMRHPRGSNQPLSTIVHFDKADHSVRDSLRDGDVSLEELKRPPGSAPLSESQQRYLSKAMSVELG